MEPIVLLEDLSLNGTVFGKGQVVLIDNEAFRKGLIDSGKAKVWEAPAPLPDAGEGSEDDEHLKLARVVAQEVGKALAEQQKASPPVTRIEVKDPLDSDPKGGFTSLGDFLKAAAAWESKSSPVDVGRVTRYVKMVEEKGKSMPEVYKDGLGLNEGLDAEGHILVPEEFRQTIAEVQAAEENLTSRCFQVSINRRITLPAFDESDRSAVGSAGARYAGVQVYFPDEGETIDYSKMYFRKVALELRKMATAVAVTSELQADSPMAVESIIARKVGAAINYTQDELVITGTGVGKPKGILKSASLVTAAAVAGQTADTVVAQNIIAIWALLHPSAVRNAIWLINGELNGQLPYLSITGAAGGVYPMYMPPGGLSGSPYGTLMGRPVMVSEHCEKLGDVGDIILWDLSKYIWANKAGAEGVQAASSMHVRFLQDEMVYRFITRVDGQPEWQSAVTPAKANTGVAYSSHVTLAARA